MLIVKRSGQREVFSVDKLKRAIDLIANDLEKEINLDALIQQASRDLFEEISTPEIIRALIMSARSRIENDPAYSFFSARLLFNRLYKEVIGAEKIDWLKFDEQYRSAFIQNIKKGAYIGRLDPRILFFDLELLSQRLQPARDNFFNYLGAQTVYDRYLLRDPEAQIILETPQAMWMRVAMGLALQEKNRDEWAIKFYDLISTLRFIPSTPTLFHSGTARPQMSSCYVNTVEDDLDHIFKVIGDNARLSKWSGGIGTDWTNLRATGALIKGTGVESQGVIPFLKIANDTTVAINRSGRRRGAACVYLEIWHLDIESFLELRKNTGDERRRTHDLDTATWIPDLFMQRVRVGADWTLFSPDETPDLHHLYGRKFAERYCFYETRAMAGQMKLFKRLPARELWKKMISMLFETGHPWITFKDPCNIRSPQDHAGVVHNSNLCTEITLNTSARETAVCNLGSINLARHIQDRQLNKEKLQETVRLATRALDNVIDINFYPTSEARESNLRHRPIGLGIMGYQDALYQLDINFDSEAAVNFSDELMEIVSYQTMFASAELAKEKGVYSSFVGSKWERGFLPLDTLRLLEEERGESIEVDKNSRLDWDYLRRFIKENGLRNSNCLAIAPTATIANIAGCLPSIEPIYKNLYVKSNVSGDFIVINPYLAEDLKKINLWSAEMAAKIKYYDGSIKNIPEIPERLREKYKEAFDIDPRWLIKAAAARAKWIDQSQSLNLFFLGSSGKAISDIYMSAWQMGLKTTYYLRTLAASQVEKSTVQTQEFGSTHMRKIMDNKTEIKLCKLNDPACESCQ
ncbi:MAG: ribonucleoside-diphosphate reductase subunit alpha [Candidatus Magasanikbacteria bacterium]|nr:ribonucleoside-diphosphate reductase subunit alpha [Candidatus Magasanikbacteria bacterium]